MTELPAVTCTVDVGVDPVTAFAAFTDEMDHWWMRTAISYYDSAAGRRRAAVNRESAAASSRSTTTRPVTCSSSVASRCGSPEHGCSG